MIDGFSLGGGRYAEPGDTLDETQLPDPLARQCLSVGYVKRIDEEPEEEPERKRARSGAAAKGA